MMKNLLIFVDPIKKFNAEHDDLVKIQIDNSLALGWKPEDILLVTNFDYEYNGVRSLIVGDDCYYNKNNFYRSTKLPVINRLFENGTIKEGEIYWFHDFDAFELAPIKEAELDLETVDAGFTNHGFSAKWNAGSFFFKIGARDIFQTIFDYMDKLNIDEQDALTLMWQENINGINSRYKLMNITYNIGIYHIDRNLEKAELPVKVAHFHPHKRRHLDLFRAMLPERLMTIFSNYRIR